MNYAIGITIILLLVILVSVIVTGKSAENNYILTHLTVIDGRNKVIKSIHSQGYRNILLVTQAREDLINMRTTSDNGDNIYFTSITGRKTDETITLTIKKTAHIFHIQKLRKQ